MSATNMRTVIADKDYECNASLFIKECLEDIIGDLSDEQKSDVEKARANNWMVKKGDMCRRYTWAKGTTEETECVEIPEMAAICEELDLFAQ